jgi:phage terminase large subunit
VPSTDISKQLMQGFDWRNPDYDLIIRRRIKMLKALRKDPKALAGIKEHFKEYPCDFITLFGSTFDPRLVERKIDPVVPFLLFPRQEEFIDWIVARWRSQEDGVAEKSRDMGVSWLTVATAVWMFLYHPGSSIGFGSRKEEYVDKLGDPKSLFWKVRAFINLLPHEFRPKGWDAKKHAPFMVISNPENGASIIGEAGDNIGRGARNSIYFVDEAAFLERPEAVDAALSQTANCKIHVSTPNGSGNPFYRKAKGGKWPLFVFDHAEDPRKGPEWYAEQVRKADNPAIIAQEIDRNYEASVSNAFISGELVEIAQKRGPTNVQAIGRLRVGVDPARFGDDKFSVTIRRGRLVLLQKEAQNLDSFTGAAFVRDCIAPYGERPEQIAVDEIGIGAGVVDVLSRMPEYQGIVVGVNVANRMDGATAQDVMSIVPDGSVQTIYYNLRGWMYGELREWLKVGSIPSDNELKAELTAVRYSYRGGSLLLESKDDMKKRGIKSPNRADSLALTFARPGSTEQALGYDIFHSQSLQVGRKPASKSGY